MESNAECVLAMCVIAGKPVKVAADLLRRGVTSQQAGRELLTARAQESGPEIQSTVLPGDSADANAEAKPKQSLAQRMAEKFRSKKGESR
jgi:hypothetical protein